MDIIQKLAKFLMIIVILPTLTGCTSFNKEETAKKALKEKYQEEFEISEIFDQKLGESSYRVQANPVSDSTLNFRASVEFKDHALSDNYVERIICHKINTQVEKNLNGLPGDYYLFTHALGPQPIANDKNISVEEYAKLDSRNRFRVELFLTTQNPKSEELFNVLKDAFKDLDYLKGEIRFYIVDSQLMKETQEYFSKNDDIYYEFSHKMNLVPYLELEYEKGILNMSESEFKENMIDCFGN